MAAVYQTLQNIFDDVRYIAGKDATTLPNTDLFRIANKYFLWLMRQEADLNEYLYGQISFTDLIANQREYPLPVDDEAGSTLHPYGGGAINILRVEISYDGTNWVVARVVAVPDLTREITTDAGLNNQSTKSQPIYYFFDRSLFIGPVPSSSDNVGSGNAGLRIWYLQRTGELDSVSDVFDIPKEFLPILAEGMLIDVFRKYGRINDMRVSEARFNAMTQEMRSLETGLDYEEQPRLGVPYKNYK